MNVSSISNDLAIIGLIELPLNSVSVFLFVGERPINWAALGGTITVVTIVIHTLIYTLKRQTKRYRQIYF